MTAEAGREKEETKLVLIYVTTSSALIFKVGQFPLHRGDKIWAR